jgi:hypothetical protein
VVIEGQTFLNDYEISVDHAKINESYQSDEHDSVEAGTFTGLVKRFEVEVRGGDGLQIDLVFQVGSAADPVLNGVRILQNTFPGDYDRNGFVECEDYYLWQATKGLTADLRADGNGDGVIADEDYEIWAAIELQIDKCVGYSLQWETESHGQSRLMDVSGQALLVMSFVGEGLVSGGL